MDCTIKEYYENLRSREKGQFTRAVVHKLSIAQTTFYKKLNSDMWKPLERDFIITIINNNSWRYE